MHTSLPLPVRLSVLFPVMTGNLLPNTDSSSEMTPTVGAGDLAMCVTYPVFESNIL